MNGSAIFKETTAGSALHPHPEFHRGNGARGSPREIRWRQWEALARGIISQGEAHEALWFTVQGDGTGDGTVKNNISRTPSLNHKRQGTF
jgi:hypothetical protein